MGFGNPFKNRTDEVAAPVTPKKRASRAMTREEREHIGRVKALPCVCCGSAGPSDAHHPREGQGGAQRAPDWLAIPLCKDCHQGPQGVHGDKTRMRLYKKTELSMLADTIRQLVRSTQHRAQSNSNTRTIKSGGPVAEAPLYSTVSPVVQPPVRSAL